MSGENIVVRKPAEHALVASEARYRRLFEAAQDGILILDAESGSIEDVNPFLIDLLDYPREEFMGKKLWEIGPFRNVDASKEAFRRLQDLGYVRYDNLPLETRTGGHINVEFVSNVYSVEEKKVIQCNIRDISARKHTEAVQEHRRQSQKMETVGQLAGGIAHDFSNLLGVILGYCQLLEENISSEDPARRMVEQIHEAGDRASALTKQLLLFSRRQTLSPTVIDLNRLVNGMSTIMGRLLGEKIAIKINLLPDLGHVKADSTQVEQILMNLAVNARDAMPDGGTITVETAHLTIIGNHGVQHPGMQPGTYVGLTFTDTGTGMDVETQAHIFEPFFTTKQPGRGTGLGLSTVYGIVKESGGHIYARSEPGRGTEFTIYLPWVRPNLAAQSVPSATVLPTILLVEDDQPMRELMRRMLEGLGYRVLHSGRPREAIRMAKAHDGHIDLLISGVVMPDVGGHELAETLTAARPQMKVLYTSGYPADPTLPLPQPVLRWPLIVKPFTREGLAEQITRLLHSALF
jgi:PAS domain S-box-containing protein